MAIGMESAEPLLRPENCALVLLAAGRSTRFGVADKLAEPFLGRPLALHVVAALEGVPFARRFAVTSDEAVGFAGHGFAVVRNDDPARGMASSLRLGVRAAQAAREAQVAGVVIALADMPRVTAAQIDRLFEAQYGADSVVASTDGTVPRPPALFGANHFAALETLTGDAGARDLILAGRHVVTTPAELIDIDTPDDAARLRALTGDAHRR